MEGVAALAATPFLFQLKHIMRCVLLLPDDKTSPSVILANAGIQSGMDAGSGLYSTRSGIRHDIFYILFAEVTRSLWHSSETYGRTGGGGA
jgi:hypothetical protein